MSSYGDLLREKFMEEYPWMRDDIDDESKILVSTERVYCIHGECDAIVIFYNDDTRKIKCPKKHSCDKYYHYACPYKND